MLRITRMRARSVPLALVAVLALATACGGTTTDRPDWVPAGVDPRMVEKRADGVVIASPESLRSIPGYVVDSIFPPPEALRRWKGELGGEGPTALTSGAPSVRSLFDGYVRALASGDSVGWDSLAVTAREFAWLYYSDGPEAKEGVMPKVVWELMGQRGAAGLGRARAAVAQGGTGTVVDVACGPTDLAIGTGRLRGPCRVVLRRPDGRRDTVALARFVFERDARTALMGYANGL